MIFVNGIMRFLIIIVITLCPLLMFSQLRWEGGFFMGIGNYYGDLVTKPYPELKESKLGVGAFMRLNLDKEWGIRLMFTHGSISGSDENAIDPSLIENRNFSFQSNYSDIGLLLEWDLAGNRRYDEMGNFHSIFSPFLGIGMGGTFFQPIPVFSNMPDWEKNPEIAKDLEFAAPTWRISLPLSAGVKIDLSPAVSLSLEASATYPFSDYLDGISLSANPLNYDWLFNAGIGISVRFPGQSKASKTNGEGQEAEYFNEVNSIANNISVDSAAKRSDIDGDGVYDEEDFCPTLAGLLVFGGCPDTDNDGVADLYDNCPEEKGPEEYNGCPPTDRDNDGVPDNKDDCPDDFGLAAFNGCPDFDEDGITDALDQCPTIPGRPESKGCPDILPFEKELLDESAAAITFASNSAVLRSDAMDVFDRVVLLMRKYPFFALSITMHSTYKGNQSAPLQLAEKRAKACYDYLLYRGISPKRMSYQAAVPDNQVDKGKLALSISVREGY
ncbi:MAG: DUF6089 family protein [Saprospiraceae bacterium]